MNTTEICGMFETILRELIARNIRPRDRDKTRG